MSNNTNLTAPEGITVCASSGPAGTAQFVVGKGFTVNITFAGTPPYRLSASPRRGNTTICTSHIQNLTSNTFTWVVDTSTNSTQLSGQSGDLSNSPGGRTLPLVFQLGDAVQWIAHEYAVSSSGGIRYYKSANYTVTSEERSIAEPSSTPRSGGLRVAEAGVVGWLVGALLLSGVAVLGL